MASAIGGRLRSITLFCGLWMKAPPGIWFPASKRDRVWRPGQALPPDSSDGRIAYERTQVFHDYFSPGHCGTEFGSAAIHIRSHTMTASHSKADVEYSPRRRDRRETFGDLLASLTRTLDGRGDLALMRGAFEQSLRRLVPVHSVQLRETTSRWIAQSDGKGGAESIVLEVPCADASSQGILEARF